MPKPVFTLFFALWLFSFLLFLPACRDGKSAGTTDAVDYVHFKIAGEEEKENVTCLFQFFGSDTAGKSMVLPAPGAVLLDNEKMEPDSTPFTGTYYEVQKPLQNFSGRHTIIYQTGAGKEIKETFDFTPFTLASEVGDRVKKGTLVLQLTGLKEKDSLNILLMDTSFATEDIERQGVAENGRLQLTKTEVARLAAGPVTLYLTKEVEREVKNGGRQMGKIIVSYSLKREFDLVD